MVKCNDCGGSISSSASKCPKCGAVTDHYCRTVEQQNEGALLFMGIFGGLPILVAIIIHLFEK